MRMSVDEPQLDVVPALPEATAQDPIRATSTRDALAPGALKFSPPSQDQLDRLSSERFGSPWRRPAEIPRPRDRTPPRDWTSPTARVLALRDPIAGPALVRMDDWLQRRPGVGNVAGIFLGIFRSFEDLVFQSAEVAVLVVHLRQTLRELIELLPLFMTDPSALAQVLRAPLLAIRDDLVAAVELAKQGRQMDCSARVIQATVKVEMLISAVAGAVAAARQLPSTIERLAGLRRNLRSALQTARRRLAPNLAEMSNEERHAWMLAQEGSVRLAVPRLNRERFANGLRARRSWHRPVFYRNPRFRFREWVIDRIVAQPGHPLEFLLDARTGNLRRAGSQSHWDLADSIGADAMHVESRWLLGDERLALGDSWLNRALDNATLESRGGAVVNEVIEIGGVPVELRSALLWERNGLLPRGTAAAARRHGGWFD